MIHNMAYYNHKAIVSLMLHEQLSLLLTCASTSSTEFYLMSFVLWFPSVRVFASNNEIAVPYCQVWGCVT